MLRSVLVILAFCSLSLSGCGTFSDAMAGPINRGGPDVYYRGVRMDIAAVKEGGPMTLMAADIPFSAVADTLLVPYRAYHELKDPPRRPLESGSEEPAKVDKPKADSLPQGSPKE